MNITKAISMLIYVSSIDIIWYFKEKYMISFFILNIDIYKILYWFI